MNFQSVKASPGQYIQLQAAIVEIKHITGDYGPYALGKAQDNQGFVEEVFFTIKKGAQFPTGLAAGHSCNWAGRWDANTQKMKLYFDSMAQRDVAAQAPVPAPPQAKESFFNVPPQEPYHVPVQQPQAPQAPPQAPNAPRPTRDATGVSIERQCTVKAVCEFYAGTDTGLATLLDACHHFHRWIETGTVDFQVSHSPMPTGNYEQEQAPTDPNQDDDIPF